MSAHDLPQFDIENIASSMNCGYTESSHIGYFCFLFALEPQEWHRTVLALSHYLDERLSVPLDLAYLAQNYQRRLDGKRVPVYIIDGGDNQVQGRTRIENGPVKLLTETGTEPWTGGVPLDRQIIVLIENADILESPGGTSLYESEYEHLVMGETGIWLQLFGGSAIIAGYLIDDMGNLTRAPKSRWRTQPLNQIVSKHKPAWARILIEH